MVALSSERNLIFDVPGGGFISMSPEHHEERLRSWAMQTGEPVISIEYGKAPECKFLYHLGLTFLVAKHLPQTHTHLQLMRSSTPIESSLSRRAKLLAWLVRTSTSFYPEILRAYKCFRW